MGVTVTCYGKSQHFRRRENAVKYYTEAASCSEGAERERYTNILFELLLTDKAEVSDKVKD